MEMNFGPPFCCGVHPGIKFLLQAYQMMTWNLRTWLEMGVTDDHGQRSNMVP